MSVAAELAGLLACPVCRADLAQDDGALTCARGHSFPVHDGVPSLLPETPAFGDHDDWERKQLAAVDEYEKEAADLEQVRGSAAWTVARLFGEAWSEDVQGARVLDVGCALRPEQAYCPPAYRPERVRVHIGVDPLRGGGERTYEVVQGVAEALPFRDDSFDAVLFGSSLDHIVGVDAAFGEARRVCRPGGRLAVWVAVFDVGFDASVLEALRLVPRTPWWRPHWWIGMARVLVALFGSARIDWRDAFHVHRFTQRDVEDAAARAGFVVRRRMLVVDHSQQVPHLILVAEAPA